MFQQCKPDVIIGKIDECVAHCKLEPNDWESRFKIKLEPVATQDVEAVGCIIRVTSGRFIGVYRERPFYGSSIYLQKSTCLKSVFQEFCVALNLSKQEFYWIRDDCK